MSWFWGSKASNDKPADPYSKLDPGLRDFLDKESPLKYEETKAPQRTTSTSTPSPDSASNEYRSQLGWSAPTDTPAQADPTATPSATPAVPPEAIFQDGRYAHLWKNYRPQSEIEAAGKNDQDRLRDVIDAYNDRRAAIGRAAVENCVFEQMAERDCWEHGSWTEKLNMCRGPNRQFMRCYTMQSRFLKALGYLSQLRSEEEEERIQMHSDRLWQDLLAREAAAEAAKNEGLDAPVMPPLISPESTTKALGEDSAWARARQKALEMQAEGMNVNEYTPDRQKQIRKQLEGLNEQEKELELQLIAAERRAQIEYAEQIKERWEEERMSRADRRDRGKETVGDTIKRLWGWDKER